MWWHCKKKKKKDVERLKVQQMEFLLSLLLCASRRQLLIMRLVEK
jgi:hypothetical protein